MRRFPASNRSAPQGAVRLAGDGRAALVRRAGEQDHRLFPEPGLADHRLAGEGDAVPHVAGEDHHLGEPGFDQPAQGGLVTTGLRVERQGDFRQVGDRIGRAGPVRGQPVGGDHHRPDSGDGIRPGDAGGPHQGGFPSVDLQVRVDLGDLGNVMADQGIRGKGQAVVKSQRVRRVGQAVGIRVQLRGLVVEHGGAGEVEGGLHVGPRLHGVHEEVGEADQTAGDEVGELVGAAGGKDQPVGVGRIGQEGQEGAGVAEVHDHRHGASGEFLVLVQERLEARGGEQLGGVEAQVGVGVGGGTVVDQADVEVSGPPGGRAGEGEVDLLQGGGGVDPVARPAGEAEAEAQVLDAVRGKPLLAEHFVGAGTDALGGGPDRIVVAFSAGDENRLAGGGGGSGGQDVDVQDRPQAVGVGEFDHVEPGLESRAVNRALQGGAGGVFHKTGDDRGGGGQVGHIHGFTVLHRQAIRPQRERGRGVHHAAQVALGGHGEKEVEVAIPLEVHGEKPGHFTVGKGEHFHGLRPGGGFRMHGIQDEFLNAQGAVRLVPAHENHAGARGAGRAGKSWLQKGISRQPGGKSAPVRQRGCQTQAGDIPGVQAKGGQAGPITGVNQVRIAVVVDIAERKAFPQVRGQVPFGWRRFQGLPGRNRRPGVARPGQDCRIIGNDPEEIHGPIPVQIRGGGAGIFVPVRAGQALRGAHDPGAPGAQIRPKEGPVRAAVLRHVVHHQQIQQAVPVGVDGQQIRRGAGGRAQKILGRAGPAQRQSIPSPPVEVKSGEQVRNLVAVHVGQLEGLRAEKIGEGGVAFPRETGGGEHRQGSARGGLVV
jgi:hypothetical protein